MDILELKRPSIYWLRTFSMLVLAALPLLAWYRIPFSVGLGYALVLLLSAYSIVINSFKVIVIPFEGWLLFLYVCIMWSYHHDFALWTLSPPGGWIFFIFVMALIWGVLTFNFDLFKKYMRLIVLISMALFWIQYMLKLSTGSQVFCFVPNLTGGFIYENMSYAELAAHHLAGDRPCSIFMEPSYMAHYYVTYLAIEWFSDKKHDKLITKEIVLIIVSLIALESGSGMVSLAVLSVVKMIKMYWNTTPLRRLLLIFLLLPLVFVVLHIYAGSEIGQAMLSRSDEFSTENTSGYTRVVGGFMMFDQLDSEEQWVGISDARERFGEESISGRTIFYVNGVQTILISLGYIGAILYFVFYACLFIKVNIVSRMCIVILLVMGLLESNYLNPYMMLLTIIPCAEYYMTKKKELT